MTDDETDGRRRRSLDSRARIVAAMLALIRGGEVTPSAEAVAEEAGVGLRTVFRHFADMESLFREMSRVMEAELRELADQPFASGDWRGRVLELIERRSGAFETIAPLRRAADALRARLEGLQADHSRLTRALRDILRRVVPDEAAADTTLFEALDLLLSFEAWDRLRRDQGLSADAARAALQRAVRALIGSRPA
jgi:AcrR family transcriptional regulator